MKFKVCCIVVSLGMMGTLALQAAAENSPPFGTSLADLTNDLLDRLEPDTEQRSSFAAPLPDLPKDIVDHIEMGRDRRPVSRQPLVDLPKNPPDDHVDTDKDNPPTSDRPRTKLSKNPPDHVDTDKDNPPTSDRPRTKLSKNPPDHVDTDKDNRPTSGDSLAEQPKEQPDHVDTDKEPRSSFGAPLAGLTKEVLDRFDFGKEDFEEEEEIDEGLGPVFNDVSCAACHKNPAVGGDSDITEIRFGTTKKENGKTTFDPMDYVGGTLMQSKGIGELGEGCNFLAEEVPKEAKHVELRKTTPLFGLGLVDAVPDRVFHNLARLQKVLSPQKAGRPAIVKNLKTGKNAVGKFGWKGQNPTLFQFGADAYVNEMGITSPMFPEENCPQGDCDLLTKCLEKKEGPDDDGSGVDAFHDFMTFLAPPSRGAITPQVESGEQVFTQIGCGFCHVSTLKTGSNPVTALHQVTFHPYSDFLLHDVGTGDGIVQADAQGNELRTPPLWGLRVRKTFLHDASEPTIEGAIRQHSKQGQDAKEAFNDLSDSEKRALIAFLKSL